jgi:hypothetical protein
VLAPPVLAPPVLAPPVLAPAVLAPVVLAPPVVAPLAPACVAPVPPLGESLELQPSAPRNEAAPTPIAAVIQFMIPLSYPRRRCAAKLQSGPLKFGEAREQIELIGASARAARLSLRDTANAGLSLAIAHESTGDRLEVQALGRAVGTSIGELNVATGLDDPAELALPFSFTVTGTLAVDPSNPYFDLLRAGGRRVQLTAKSAQPGFRVLGVDVLNGPFQASFSGSPGGTYRVEVTVLPERAQGEQRGTLGHLRLRSNDRSEPAKDLTLMAFGRGLSASNP